MKVSRYFVEQVQRKRPYLTLELCERVVNQAVKDELQQDGRRRYWAFVPELGNRALRVVVLADGDTIHNAFLDRRFKG